MAALRRGIAHYQSGTEDTPDTPTPPPDSWRTWLGNAIGMRGREAQQQVTSGGAPTSTPVAPVAPAAPAAPAAGSWLGSIGDLYAGQYGRVLADPNASAFASYLAKTNQDVINQRETHQRALDLATGPNNVEKLVKGLFGTQADWDEIKARDATAATLGHPLIQQHLKNTPDELAAAEQDPHAYANHARTNPAFQQVVADAVKHNAEAEQNSKIDPKDRPAIVNGAVNIPGASTDHVNASMHPGKYTDEEFVKLITGMPTKTAHMLFGPVLGHILTPQQQAVNDYRKELQAPLDKLIIQYNAETDPKKRKAIYGEYTKGHQYMMQQLGTIAKGFQAMPSAGGQVD